MLTSTQKYDQLKDMVKNSTLVALPKNDDTFVENKNQVKDNSASKINLMADEVNTDIPSQPK